MAVYPAQAPINLQRAVDARGPQATFFALTRPSISRGDEIVPQTPRSNGFLLYVDLSTPVA